METSLVSDLSLIRKGDIGKAGGKGAHLGELMALGMPVPPGFCVTAQAYDEIAAPALQKIAGEFAGADLADVREARQCGEMARRLIMGLNVPEKLRKDVLSAVARMQHPGRVAVRSSATMEDLPEFSFAGQHDTYLNVAIGDLFTHVKKCWGSLWTDRAISYRHKNRLDHFRVSLAVVVQKMVRARVAGVLFTVNPVTNRQEITISANWGLGESLVSGKVTPDEYTVDTSSLRTMGKTIGDKAIMVELQDVGTRETEVPPAKRKEQCLSDVKIREIAELGRKIQAHYHSHQDIEWAVAGEEIFILQARPVTAINSAKPVPVVWASEASQKLLEGYTVFWSNWNVRETMPYPFTPLSWATLNNLLFRPVFEFAFGIPSDSRLGVYHSVIDLVYGRPYWNMNILYGHPLLGPIMKKGLTQIDKKAGEIFNDLYKKKELKPARLGFNLFFLGFAVYQTLRLLLCYLCVPFYFNVRRVKRRNAAYWQKVCEFAATDLSRKSDVELVKSSMDFSRYTARSWTSSFLYLGYGDLCYRVLVLLTRKWPDISTSKLLAGIPGNKTTEGALELYKLSIMPENLKRVFLENDLPAILPALKKSAEGEQFLRRFAHYLEFYGHRAVKEFDIAQPRWEEDFTFIWQMIRNYLQLAPGDITPLEHFRRMAAAGEATAALARRRLSGSICAGLFPIKRWLFDLALKLARIYMPLREAPKYYVLKCFAANRKIYGELGARFCRRGFLANADDIYFLTIREIEDLARGGAVEAPQISHRKREWEKNLSLEPPFIVRSDGMPVLWEEATANTMSGTPVSGGRAQGRARIILDPEDGCSFNKGEILVAPFTDPGWTPLFLTARALVMEVGGVMSHGAVVAREYGIPAVVGVKDATRLIKTGDEIVVDGDTGMVGRAEE